MYLSPSSQDVGVGLPNYCVSTPSLQLNLLHVELVENAVLCGARFMDNGGSRFAVSAYDSHEIKTFIRKSTPV